MFHSDLGFQAEPSPGAIISALGVLPLVLGLSVYDKHFLHKQSQPKKQCSRLSIPWQHFRLQEDLPNSGIPLTGQLTDSSALTLSCHWMRLFILRIWCFLSGNMYFVNHRYIHINIFPHLYYRHCHHCYYYYSQSLAIKPGWTSNSNSLTSVSWVLG